MRLRRRRAVVGVPALSNRQVEQLVAAARGFEPPAVAVVRDTLHDQCVPGLDGDRVQWAAEAVVHDLRAAGMLSEEGG